MIDKQTAKQLFASERARVAAAAVLAVIDDTTIEKVINAVLDAPVEVVAPVTKKRTTKKKKA